MEIERKFLIPVLPENLENYPHKEIEQAYLCTVGTTVRIRRANDTYYLTIKQNQNRTGDAAIQNLEIEQEITQKAYEHLRGKCDCNPVTKTRYYIPYLEYCIELDVFHGVLTGLQMAEIEFPSDSCAQQCVIPDWFGEEVTFSPHYRNSFLSTVSSLQEV